MRASSALVAFALFGCVKSQPVTSTPSEVSDADKVLAEHCRKVIGEPHIERVSANVWDAVGYDQANTILIKTPAGNVIIDPSMTVERGRLVKDALMNEAPGKTLAIIYTHSHIDH